MSKASLRDEIARTLEGYQAQAIYAMGAAHGLERARHPRKQDLIGQLAERLASPKLLDERVAALEPAQREALAYAARKGGIIALRSLTTLLRGQVEPAKRADDLLLDLLKQGLLLYVTSNAAWKYDFSSHDPTFPMRPVWVPRSLAGLISVEGDWARLVAPAPAPTRVVTGDPSALLRDVYLTLRGLRARPMRLTQQMTPHQSDMRRWVLELRPHRKGQDWREGIDDLLFTLYLTLTAGLLDQGDQGLTPNATAESFVALPPAAQVTRLLAAWLTSPWSELTRVPTLVLDGYMAPYGDVPGPEQVGGARRVLVEVLRALPTDEWASIASMSAAIRRRDPDFLIGSQTSPNAFFSSLYGGYGAVWPGQGADHYRGIRRAGVEYQESLLARDSDWEEVEGGFIRAALGESLIWLGVTEVGLDADGRPESVRVTPLGRAALSGGPPAATPTRGGGPRLVVQPNFELIVLDVGQGLDLMARLDQFATQRTVDRAAVYHLERGTVVRALQGSLTLAEIERLLVEESGAPLPQNVGFSLAEWARQAERVTLRRRATLLEAPSPAELDRWLASPDLAPHLGARLGPTVVLLAGLVSDGLLAALRRRGRVSIEDATPPAAGALRVADGGVLLARNEGLNRFERHRLESFAEVVEQERAVTRYRVTAESAARARARGWTAPLLLGLLGRRLGQAPPADLALSLRGWLGDIAPAQQAVVRLVRLPDAAVWPVIESAAAGGLLTRVGQQHAIMDEVVLARVGEALTRRGIRLEATTPETAAGPLLSGGAGAPAPERDGLQTLRGRALREFLTEAIDRDRRVVILHQAANQKAPRRMTIKPNYLDHRPTGYYVSARTEQQTERAFKLDDIFGIALEEQP